MKSARKLFEELGYEYKKLKNSYIEDIIYEKGSKRILFRYDKTIIPYSDYGNTEGTTLITLKELQAINQQINELNWK